MSAAPVALDTVLAAEAISKTFTGMKALDGVDFSLEPGEVHALVGGNGSGKSTLIKVLAGVYTADAGGTITANGRTIAADQLSPADSREAGLRFVHQDLGLFPEMTIAENLSAGAGFAMSAGRISWRQVNEHAAELIDRYAIRGTPTTQLNALRPADRTLVAIARALQDQEGGHQGVLFLDEPTTSLPPHEVDVLLARLRDYAAMGQTIVFVSHRLPEILRVADRATVLRDGHKVSTGPVAGLSESDLVELIVGRPVGQVYPTIEKAAPSQSGMRVTGLAGGPIRDVTFEVHPGEVIGIAGLLGSGRSSLLQLLMGVHKRTSGSIELNGSALPATSVESMMSAGFALVPEDRSRDAAFLDHAVGENLSAAQVGNYWQGLFLRHRKERLDTVESIKQFGVKATADQPMQTLSGGNQQKVVLARWLRRKPSVLLLDEPTQGVDIGARVEIYKLMRDAAGAGSMVIVVSSDFDELARLCSRVLVLNGGRIVAEAAGSELEPARLAELSFSRGPDSGTTNAGKESQ